VPILVFLCLYVLDLGPMYATGSDRQTSDVIRQTDVRRQTKASLNAPAYYNHDYRRSGERRELPSRVRVGSWATNPFSAILSVAERFKLQETQLSLTNRATRLEVSQCQQTW